jgi:WD40 repeat protein/serine/threonine protein kinase
MTDTAQFTARSEAADSLLGRLADEFVAAHQRDEPQDVEQLAARYPELADVIRQTFPAMLVLREPHDSNSCSVELLHGEELGDFRLIRELGRGGMGVVYEAMQRSLGRRVALKVLPLAGMLDERRLRRFQNEAHAAAALQHPHIVPVFGVGCERGVHYYAMQLIQGVSLAEVLHQLRKTSVVSSQLSVEKTVGSGATNNERLTTDTRPHTALSTIPSPGSREYFRTVARLGIQAAEALAYAHREGVVHRDVKPSNLLIDESGKLWVTDFGLARMHAGGELTLSGDVLGTLRYMSPEQLTDNKVVDQRTDVYSLGLTLYEMLVGRPAFADVPREQLAQKILSEDPRPPRTADASIPIDLETIILRATVKDRDVRYQSAADLAADLARFVECKPILARRPTRVQRIRYWARRNVSLAATLLLLFVAMAALSIGGPIMAWREAAMVREYRRQLDIADLNVAYQAWYEGNVNQVEDVLARHTPAEDHADQRSFAWRYLRSMYERSQSNIIARHNGAVKCVAVSPDGKTVASAGQDGRILFTDPANAAVVRSWLAHDGEVMSLAYDPAGEWLASGSADGLVKIWSAIGEPTCLAAFSCGALVRSLAVTSDGKYVIAGTSSGKLSSWSTMGGEPRWSIPAHKQAIWDVAISPSGLLLATASADNSLQIRRTDSGELVRRIDDFWGNAFGVAFSLDELKLVAGTADGTRVWDIESGKQLAGLDAFSQVAASIAIAQDGLIATGAYNRMITFWDDWSGHRIVDHMGNREAVTSVAFFPDGRTLVSGGEDGSVRTYDARDAQRRRQRWHRLKNSEWGTSVALSANGRTLVSTTISGWPGDDAPNGELTFWDLASGTPRVTHSITMRDAPHVAVSPDGTIVATCGLGGLRLWDGASGQPRESLYEEPQHCLLFVAFSRDGRWLATGGRDQPREGKAHGLVTLWYLAENPPRRIDLPINPGYWQPWIACFTSDSRHLAVGGDHTWRDCWIDVWALDEGGWQLKREKTIRTASRISSISAFPTSNELVVTAWDGEIVVQDIEADAARLAFRGHSRSLYSSALTADGSLVATGGYPKITLWDAATGDQLGALTMPTWVSNLAFTPDGNTLIWAGGDGSVNFERTTELRAAAGQ